MKQAVVSSPAADVQPSGNKEHDYYGWMRGDLLVYVPSSTRNVLSVGCGGGATEAELIKNDVSVVGIELDQSAAERARDRGIEVIVGDASKIDDELGSRRFDCIMYADVLEHIADPVAVLQRHVKRLDPGGTVIISVPNFRHYSVFWQLFVRGHVHYRDAGIFDRTHLRLTTRRMIMEWLGQVGLDVVTFHLKLGPRRRFLSYCTLGLTREFLAKQLIVVGRKPG